MSVVKRYVLDASVFIEAHKNYYASDICPGFWSALVRQHDASRVCSIDRVKSELKNVYLKAWISNTAPKTLFKGTADKNVVDVFGRMVKWVQSENQFTLEAKAEFASVADGWLIAFAKVNGLIVVTHEQYAPDAKKNVKIPNVCIEFNVKYCNTFEMLRDLKEQFVLKTRQRRK